MGTLSKKPQPDTNEASTTGKGWSRLHIDLDRISELGRKARLAWTKKSGHQGLPRTPKNSGKG